MNDDQIFDGASRTSVNSIKYKNQIVLQWKCDSLI